MLRASIDDPDDPLVIIGLSEGNLERLKADRPILLPFRAFGLEMPGRIMVFYGPTETAMEAVLHKHGLIGPETRGSVDPRLDQQQAILDEHPRILICTVGLPRSGKSTWARRQSWPIVCPDAIRLAIHGQRYVQSAERFTWATAHAMVQSLFLAGHRAVIVDATNVTRNRRDEWRSPEWGTFFKVIRTPVETCLERARQEQDEYILPVIERMAAAWEPLDEDEPQWPA